MEVPVGALISIPWWFEEAPLCQGFPASNPEVIRPLAGHGHVKLMSPRLTVLYVCAALFAAAAFLLFLGFLSRFLFLPFDFRLDGLDLVFLRLDRLRIFGDLTFCGSDLRLVVLELRLFRGGASPRTPVLPPSHPEELMVQHALLPELSLSLRSSPSVAAYSSVLPVIGRDFVIYSALLKSSEGGNPPP